MKTLPQLWKRLSGREARSAFEQIGHRSPIQHLAQNREPIISILGLARSSQRPYFKNGDYAATETGGGWDPSSDTGRDTCYDRRLLLSKCASSNTGLCRRATTSAHTP